MLRGNKAGIDLQHLEKLVFRYLVFKTSLKSVLVFQSLDFSCNCQLVNFAFGLPAFNFVQLAFLFTILFLVVPMTAFTLLIMSV